MGKFTNEVERRIASKDFRKPGPKKEKKPGAVVTYTAYCPKCKYTTYSQKIAGSTVSFSCSCRCTFNLKKEFCRTV
jgi:hypothetical protein